ncbi:hypothetical protein [Runella zeae]|uniref:hypothetical protein n=1 Tax=Runella zeae TaxID=94255 RepID=UPI002352CCC8|nr:hypothetical protein [Runella zeae]
MCSIIDINDNADPCNKNIGGTEDIAYYALLADFAAFPDLPLSETDLEDKFLILSGFTFKTGKCWKKLQLSKDSGRLSYESVGNAGALSAVFNFGVAGNNLHGQLLNNLADNLTPYVFLVQRNSMPAGRYDLVGSDVHKAALKGGYDGGEKSGNGGMYNFEARATQKFETHYSGTVQLTPQA